MTPHARGFLLLSSHLGNPERDCLSAPQLRTLASRIRNSDCAAEDRDLTVQDLVSLGYRREMAARIKRLLDEEDLLDHYLRRSREAGCVPITRADPEYPQLIHQRLGLDAPGCLWARGDLSLLRYAAVSLVGCRELREENRVFASEVGRQAALQGLALVSGNARGSDRAAQAACLEAGGKVISIVANELYRQPEHPNVLYLSEGSFDDDFTAQRALSRNRCIHALGLVTFVAQSEYRKGGTWDGTVKNLRFGWSPVGCFQDGSESAQALQAMGAFPVDTLDLADLGNLLNSLPQMF